MNEIVKLNDGDLEVELWTLGARLNGVWFQGSKNLVDAATSLDEALGSKKFNGATVGPVANRIANGEATINDQTFRFERNESEITTLHSGTSGVHAQNWQVDEVSKRDATLRLELADGLGGFPGNRTLTAVFGVNGDRLQVNYAATTDAPTWVNLALHPYWSLGVGRAKLRLSVDADRYLPVDAHKIPTESSSAVSGSAFDLRSLTAPDIEIDHNYCLGTRRDGVPAVVLASEAYRLEIDTDAPGVQVYTGKEIGIAIEPQHWPDAMHHESFPSIELKPGETYQQTSVYRFTRL